MRGKFRKSLLVIIGGMLLIGGTSSISRDSLISDNNEQEKEVIDPFYYETKEIYVCFTDGRCELYRYDTEEQVIQALNDLRHRDDVEFYQPNYRYYNTATYITDMNYKEQWAFHNDGTFVVKSESEIDDSKKQNENHTVFTESMDQVWKDWYQSISGLNISLMDMTQTEHDSSIESGKAKKGIDIAMEDAWDSYKGGVRETVVAIIDTGIDYHHEELKDAMWKNEDEIPNDGIDNDGNGYIDDIYGWNFYDDVNEVYVGLEDSHGTHSAGTIAATRNDIGITGIVDNSTVKLMSLKILGGKNQTGTTASIVEAIKYAKQNGAVICNLSFGTYDEDKALKKAIKGSGLLFVAAAGNARDRARMGTNNDMEPIYPACYGLDNVISVANLSFTGKLSNTSNYGKKTVDLAAPGTYIYSTRPQNEYGYMTGTSMAAPMVTGVAAMLYSSKKDSSIEDVKNAILLSTRKLDDLTDKVATGGMLDASLALNKLSSPDESETKKAIVPKISIKYVYLDGQKYLKLIVKEGTSKINYVAYGNGKLKKASFRGKNDYKKIKLEKESTYFKIKKNGIFTFYVIDKKGNEVIKTVKVEK